VTRLIDRMGISRLAGYNEAMWSGAYEVSSNDPGGRSREGVAQHIVRHAREAYKANGPVFACVETRQALLSEAVFQFQRQADKSLFGTQDLTILEHPWPNADAGELWSRLEVGDSTAGNAYVQRVEPSDDSENSLRVMRADLVTIVSAELHDTQDRVYKQPVGYIEDVRPLGIDREPQFYTVDEVAHYCVDEETQILTAGGWKSVDDLRPGDEALTLNHQTGMSEWQPVTEVCVFPAARREMISMEGRDHSSLTTPNHRWPAEYRISRRQTYGRRWVTSETIGAGDRIPVAAIPSDLPADPKWSDALVEAVAWFWTEGCIRRRHGRPTRAVTISQSAVVSEPNVVRIRAALTTLFGPAAPDRRASHSLPRWSENLSGRNVIFRLNSAAGDVLTAHAPGKIVTTVFLRALTRAQLDLFIAVSLLADNNGPRRLAQRDPAAAEAFALACILAGSAVSLRQGSVNQAGYRMTNARMLSKLHIYPQERHGRFRIRRVGYDGRVWCPRTPNQTWLARRRGSIWFTGNSPTIDPDANWRGMSWLVSLIREVRGDDAITSYRTTHLDNGAMPGIVVKYTRKLKDETVETLAKRLTAKHSGPENAGKIWVLDEGADATVVGSTLEQLQLEALTHVGERRICAAAGPGLDVILGFEQGDYQAAVRRLSDLWARPRWRKACAVLQHLVPNVPLVGVKLWFDVSGIAALREGELQRGQTTLVKAQAVQSFVSAGFTRESAIAAADSGDISQLKPDPNAPTPGMAGRVTETEHLGQTGGQATPAPGIAGTVVQKAIGPGRPPQAGKPEALPGVGKPNVPNAKPGQFQPSPPMPNGARGSRK